ncbi:DUF547 domain-containing protein [candidate division KSB3 bacterium]|uniref:DUF547 domain-containing protein n=1 Tax=candidate division KSB3 bacterium TaxID=2044937 RepID=A0A9D5Q6U2_9BACT|nr:DUF547 domain-containing protein [candidate division KSB3 bacterium]MBD3325261.1 DUF547 domain-containing protein [candidate division KSB3 bacterium]
MLIPKGTVIHENLNTSFTHIDQLVDGLQHNEFSGYCLVSFWQYTGIIFFEDGKILNALEESDAQAETARTGETATASILAKGREKDGEISVYRLSQEMIWLLVASLHATAKYEQLSTDLTSVDRVAGLLQKGGLSGYIEVILEQDAGNATLFFQEGTLLEAVWAPVETQIVGDSVSLEEIEDRCERYGAVFNVYQARDLADGAGSTVSMQGNIPLKTVRLFETILVHLESITDSLATSGKFQQVFKTILPHLADQHPFLDPFIGDFRYSDHTLTYQGDASYDEFTNGMCDVINETVSSLLTQIPEQALLPKISASLETVTTSSSDLIDELNLETRLPRIFQDYSFFTEEYAHDADKKKKDSEARIVLNLQGIGVSDIEPDSILREFYRVIASMFKKYTEPKQHRIHYSQIKKSREYQEYQMATALLQKFDVSYLPTRQDQLAFWLNVYNFLVIDGVIKFGVTTNIQNVKGFFTRASYRLGAHIFSLDDIEHGILRNNQRRPYSLFRQFSGSDPREALCITPPDNRVHCCFCCAAKSCPPLALYSPKKVEQQLELAVKRYLLTHGMRLNREKNELWLSRTFYWYRKDFEADGNTVIDFVIEALHEKEIGQFIRQNRDRLTLRFMEYDWSLNGS